MAVGDYLIRVNGTDADVLPNTGTNLDITSWSTQTGAQGTDITYSAGVFTLAVPGVYLVILSEQFATTNTTNNERVEVQQEILLNGAVSVLARSQGYIRKSSGDQDCVCHGVAIIRTTSANETLQARFYRTDNSTSGTVNRVAGAGGGMTVVRLDENDSFARYRRIASFTIDPTESSVTWDTTDEEGPGFSRSGSDITIANAGRYFACYSIDTNQGGSGSRTVYISFFELDGTESGGRSQVYQRGADSTQEGALSASAIMNVSAGQVLTLRTDEITGQAATANDANLQIWRLPTSAEEVIATATTGNMNTTGSFALSTEAFRDSSFTFTPGESEVGVTNGGFCLVCAEISTNATTGVQRAAPILSLGSNVTRNAIDDTYHRSAGGAGSAAVNVCSFLPAVIGAVSLDIEQAGNSGTLTANRARLSLVDLSTSYNYALPPAITSAEDNVISLGETDINVVGLRFGSVQGTGKVELVQNSDYTGTIVAQTINSWSDTTVNIDMVQGALAEGSVFLFLTNDDGDRSLAFQVTLGDLPYTNTIGNLAPDHHWTWDNTNEDVGNADRRDTGQNISGTPGFAAVPICRTNVQSLSLQNNDRTECLDVSTINASGQARRTMGGWIRVETIQKTLASIYKEGGNINNACFLLGYGNTLLAQVADTGDFNVQAFSNFRLTPGRPYHIMFWFSASGFDNEFRLYIDGEQQAVTSGNPPNSSDLDSHIGDITWGLSDSSLEVGGTDVTFDGPDQCYYAQWASWTITLSNSQIDDDLFLDGALPDTVVASQADLDAIANTTRPDWPVAIQVNSNGDLELTANNVVFDERATVWINWKGNNLTWRNGGTSNLRADKVRASGGGTVTIVSTATVRVEVRDIVTNAVIQDARVLVLADTGGPLPVSEGVSIVRSGATATVTHSGHGLTRSPTRVLIRGADQDEYNGIKPVNVIDANTYTFTVSGTPATPATGSPTSTAVVVEGLSDVAGLVEGEVDFISAQPVTGRVRRGTTSPRYQTAPIAGTIQSAGLSLVVLMISDE